MRIVEVRKKEDCFDGSMIFEYLFDDGFSRHLMHQLAKGGTLQFFPDFARPFFKLATHDGLHIKGIIDNPSIEVLFPITRKKERKVEFEGWLADVLARFG